MSDEILKSLAGHLHRRNGDGGVPWKGLAIAVLSILLSLVSAEWYRAQDHALTLDAEHQKDHDALTAQRVSLDDLSKDVSSLTITVAEINRKQDERWVEIVRALGIPPRPAGYETPPTPRFRP